MSYDVSIQPKDSGAPAQRSRVEAFISSLPGVRQESPGVFACGNQRRIHAHIYTGETNVVESIEVSVPAAFTGTGGEQALALCFQIAEHLGWQVFDSQVGDYLDKNMAAEVPRRRSTGKPGFGEIFGQQFACHSGWVLLPTLIVAALVAGYFIVQRGVAESRFSWIFFGTALGIHFVRALVCSIWQIMRGEKK